MTIVFGHYITWYIFKIDYIWWFRLWVDYYLGSLVPHSILYLKDLKIGGTYFVLKVRFKYFHCHNLVITSDPREMVALFILFPPWFTFIPTLRCIWKMSNNLGIMGLGEFLLNKLFVFTCRFWCCNYVTIQGEFWHKFCIVKSPKKLGYLQYCEEAQGWWWRGWRHRLIGYY